MEIKVSYKHIKSTDVIDQKISQKTQKLKKFFHGKMYVDWICSYHGEINTAEATVRGDHVQVHASADHHNLYKSIDEVVIKLEKQIAKKSEQLKDKIHRKKFEVEE